MHRQLAGVRPAGVPLHDGVRATAEEFFALADDDCLYELIDGVVIMSPSPMPLHQRVALEIVFQLETYLRSNPVGMVFHEVDVQLSSALVYRPEVVYIRRENLQLIKPRIAFPPDLVVEVVSPESRARDAQTKFTDYGRHGVHEYWLIDPERESIVLYRLDGGRYVDLTPAGASFTSRAVEGFALDLNGVRSAFRALG